MSEEMDGRLLGDAFEQRGSQKVDQEDSFPPFHFFFLYRIPLKITHHGQVAQQLVLYAELFGSIHTSILHQ